MKIYCAHSSGFDFLNEYYKPIQESAVFQQHEFVFPHLPGQPFFNSKPVIESCDLVLAEVSFASTGMGIEIGWAISAGVPVWALHMQDKAISSAIKPVVTEVIPYTSLADVLQRL